MDRFDKFLSKYLVEYLENEYINEIVITDENGNDIEKIKKVFPDNNKLILIKNQKRLGPFLNKHKACSIARNEWIVLMDSDNFADKDYFIIAKEYISENIKEEKNVIISPSKAKPIFDFSHLSGFIFNKNNFKENREKEKIVIKPNNIVSETLFNVGNYILNKYLINNLDISNEIQTICRSHCCDVMYFNVLLFEKLDINFHVVPNLEYEHVVHNDSIYMATRYDNQDVSNMVKERFYNL
jgi:hypothetical protein